MDIHLLRLPSDPSAIAQLEPYLEEVSKRYSVHPAKFPDILISLTEAVNNAIIHGNKCCQQKYVEVHLENRSNGLAFHVSDEGTGFDPAAIPDPTLADHIACCGGRGVYIMQHLSDSMQYLNQGRTVEMYFQL